MKLGGILRAGQTAGVGLDIGSNSVKLAEVTRRGGKTVLTNFGIGDLLPEAIVDGEVMDRDVVIDTIRELFESRHFKAREVTTAVSGRAVIVKKILVDKMPPEEASEAVYIEAEQHIPYSIEDVYLDYQVLKPQGEKNEEKMELLLVAAKRDMVDAHAALVRDAGLVPRVIDVDSFAVQNAYEANYSPDASETVLLMNVGAFVSNLNIVRGGLPLFTRDLSIAGNTFVEQVQKRLDVDRDKARDLLWGAESERPPEIAEIVSAIGEDLSVGIERALAFLKTSGEAERIDRIVLSGGTSRVPGLLAYLVDRHGVPVEVGNPLARIHYEQGLFGGEEAESVSPTLMVAVGLALRTR
jgi:type IV pilus assembly protein PilM